MQISGNLWFISVREGLPLIWRDETFLFSLYFSFFYITKLLFSMYSYLMKYLESIPSTYKLSVILHLVYYFCIYYQAAWKKGTCLHLKFSHTLEYTLVPRYIGLQSFTWLNSLLRLLYCFLIYIGITWRFLYRNYCFS